MKQKLHYNMYYLLSLFFKHGPSFLDVKILETMYDKNEFLQLLEYFLPNIIMKQQQICTANKIVTSLFLRWPLIMKKARDVSVADITVVDITAEDFT